jgi:hypothetical protein
MDEPTHDPEIHRWFQGLGPPPAQQAPPYLHARVRARILSRRRRAGIGAWMGQFGHPLWATALTIVLILSLGANIWWGLGGRAREVPAVAEEGRSWTVYPFQAQLPPNEALQAAVAAHAAIEPEWIGRSFVAGQDPRVAFFRMGTIYTDALAALHSRSVDVASAHIRRLTEVLHHLQAPAILLAYLQEITTWMQRPSYTEVDLTQLLALFEPLYVTAYAQQDDHQAASIFQMAAWLENMALALAASDPVIPQPPVNLDIYLDTLIRFQAPSTVIEAFKQIRPLATRAVLSQTERHQMRSAIQTIQQLLGAMTG